MRGAFDPRNITREKHNMRLIDKLESKLGRFAIKRLMIYIIIAYAAGYIMYYVGANDVLAALSLNAEKILHGQVWRIVTFVVQPPTNSMPIFLLITLYFYYMIGSILEKQWGAFKFNVYFFTGMLMHVAAAIVIYLIFGINMMMSVYYLNMSLFMAYAIEAPNNTILLFFIIPFKTSWLAIIDGIYIGLTILLGYLSAVVTFPYDFQMVMANVGIRLSPTNATAAAIAMLNFVIYFILYRPKTRYTNTQKNFRAFSGADKTKKAKKQKKDKTNAQGAGDAQSGGAAAGSFSQQQARHRCAICGVTDVDEPDEEFRFCTSCEGAFEYCSKHLHTHVHVHRGPDGRLVR